MKLPKFLQRKLKCTGKYTICVSNGRERIELQFLTYGNSKIEGPEYNKLADMVLDEFCNDNPSRERAELAICSKTGRHVDIIDYGDKFIINLFPMDLSQ